MAALDHPAFRSGEYDTGFCAEHSKELLRPPDRSWEEVALIAAAVAAFGRDHDGAANASAAPAGASASAWARLGRTRALRGGSR
jgi:acetyl-CoA carboxylase biotin carboxylase subunit